MQNRFFITISIFLAVSALISCSSSKHSKTKRLPGTWQVSPITIDGKNNDWPSAYPEYDEKAQIGYAISNDKENLYITMETGDPATQLKILKEGMTVWIDKSGSEDEVMAINYPLPSANKSPDRPKAARSSQGQGTGNNRMNNDEKLRMDLEDKVKKALSEANEYSLQGFKACNLQFPIMELDSCGIVVRMAMDTDNELIWEARVPFKSFYPKPEIARMDKGKPMSVCFETTAMKRPASQGNGGGGGGNNGGFRPSIGMGGMGMGMRMGGGGGGMRGGNRNNTQQNNMMEPAYKSTKTWKTFGLGFPNQTP